MVKHSETCLHVSIEALIHLPALIDQIMNESHLMNIAINIETCSVVIYSEDETRLWWALETIHMNPDRRARSFMRRMLITVEGQTRVTCEELLWIRHMRQQQNRKLWNSTTCSPTYTNAMGPTCSWQCAPPVKKPHLRMQAQWPSPGASIGTWSVFY